MYKFIITSTFIVKHIVSLSLKSTITLIITQLIVIVGMDKFLSRRPIFRRHNFICAPDREREKIVAQYQSTRLIGTSRNVVFCFLLPK